ncbi:MAG: AMP-binding protein [Chitinivibrionales bacterium]|nr:AMP-binding protein [Chitinivibrionales bacterium]
MYFRPELSWEFLSADEIEAKSVRALRNHIRHVKEVSPHYQETFFDVFPEDIKTPADVARLPFTNKKDVAADTPRFLGVAPQEIVETLLTGGATGSPLAIPLTASDIERLAFSQALSFQAAGVQSADKAQILVSQDRLAFAPMAYYRGMALLGANVARVGQLPLEQHKRFLDLLQPSVLVGAPSFLKMLLADLKKRGFDSSRSSVKKLFCCGESVRTQEMRLNGLGDILEKGFNAAVYSTYTATELCVAYCECSARSGGHAHPELVYTEIVDDTGNPVADGMPGELVATTLGCEGMPLVRYRTGDITFKMSATCACGRNSCRIGPILARKSQLIKVRGATLYPLSITSALDELQFLDDYVVVLEGTDPLSDTVTIHAVTAPTNIVGITNQLRTSAKVQFPVLVTNGRTLDALRGNTLLKTKIVDKRSHAQ